MQYTPVFIYFTEEEGGGGAELIIQQRTYCPKPDRNQASRQPHLLLLDLGMSSFCKFKLFLQWAHFPTSMVIKTRGGIKAGLCPFS